MAKVVATRRAGDRREDHAGEDAGRGKAALDAADHRLGEVDEAPRHAAMGHQIAGEDEEGDRQQREGIEAGEDLLGNDQKRQRREESDAEDCRQYEVRSCAGWHRHVTLAMLAQAYLAARRKVVVGARAHARPGSRPAPAYRAGDPPPAPAARLTAQVRQGSGTCLVTLAPPPPATRPPLSLATTNLH